MEQYYLVEGGLQIAICASVMWKEHAGRVESCKIYLMMPTKAASSTMGYVVFFTSV